jgi:enoyl-CoA hydratase/carnithine racemase
MAKFKEDKKAFRVATNHLDGRLIGELSTVFSSPGKFGDPRAIILTSSHLVGFCRGAKIEVLQGASSRECRAFITEAQKLILAVGRCPLPVAAALNGLTLGGGLELAMACDYRISTRREQTVFGLPEASLGIIPAMGGTQNLARLVGRELALELIRSARQDIPGTRALECGLLDQLVAPAELIDRAYESATQGLQKVPLDETPPTINSAQIRKEIKTWLADHKVEPLPEAAGAPLSSALLNFLMVEKKDLHYLDGLEYEKEILCYLQRTADFREGIEALTAERAPVFKGR